MSTIDSNIGQVLLDAYDLGDNDRFLSAWEAAQDNPAQITAIQEFLLGSAASGCMRTARCTSEIILYLGFGRNPLVHSVLLKIARQRFASESLCRLTDAEHSIQKRIPSEELRFLEALTKSILRYKSAEGRSFAEDVVQEFEGTRLAQRLIRWIDLPVDSEQEN